MVAVLVRLKLTLLRNTLRRSVWRTVGLVLGLAYGLGLVVLALVGLVALRSAPAPLAADVTVLAFGLLTAGWLVMSLLVSGVDETVDPAKFALLPVRAGELLPGMLVAGLLGVPGLATVLLGLGLVVAWTRTATLTLAALVAWPLGVLSAFLLARAATAGLASVLGSRRFKDLAFLVLGSLGLLLAVAGNLAGRLVSRSGAPRQLLADVAEVVGWTPFGWAWAVPAEVARGRGLAAGVHLALAVALVAGLLLAWRHLLAQRLTSPLEVAATAGRIRGSGRLERWLPATPAGAVAVRTLRYWRRDPRYLIGVAGLLVAPVVIVVTQLTGGTDNPWVVVVLAPASLAGLLGLSLAQDMSYDGSAIWTHVTAGVRGAEDRAGRVLTTLVVCLPILVVMLAVGVALTGRVDLLAPALGLSAALVLGGLGVGSVVGALWQWPAPPPGTNPFGKGSTGGLPALLSVTVTAVGTGLVALPTVALVVWSVFTPWVGWLSVPVGLVTGLVALRVGLRRGGEILDRRWPEVLQAVSERAG